MKRLLALPYLYSCIVFILLIYLLCAAEHYEWISHKSLTRLVHGQMLSNRESSAFELLSAVAWFVAILLFLHLFVASCRKRGLVLTSWWLGFFLALSVFAFGEEISWGDHLFDYAKDSALAQVNAQRETNLHNLDLTNWLAIDGDTAYYRYAQNLGHLLTPLFYLLLAFLWVFLPALKRHTRLGKSAILQAMPSISASLGLFFLIHALCFLFIDTFLFNVGQVFEMYISLVTVIVALDIFKAEVAT